jgi:hypothetical protein
LILKGNFALLLMEMPTATPFDPVAEVGWVPVGKTLTV